MLYNKLELILIIALFLKKYHNSLSLTVRCGHAVKHIKSKHTGIITKIKKLGNSHIEEKKRNALCEFKS